jgi:transcriptional regulator with XRE-family HTH domain
MSTGLHQGERIRQLVESSGLTINEIAKKAGVHRARIYEAYEKDRLTTKLLEKIGNALGMSIEMILQTHKDEVKGAKGMHEIALLTELLSDKEFLKKQIEQKDHEINKLLHIIENGTGMRGINTKVDVLMNSLNSLSESMHKRREDQEIKEIGERAVKSVKGKRI